MKKNKDKQFKNKTSIFPFLRRLMKYSLKYKKWVLFFTLFVTIVAIIEAIMPVLWMNMIDNFIIPMANIQKNNTLNEINNSGLIKYSSLFLACGIILALSVFGFISFAGRIQENVMFDIRQELFIKLQKLSFSFYDKSAIGWLISRISSDAVKVTELISWGMIEVIWGIGMIIFCVISMFIFNWKLALVVTLTLPFLTIVSFKIRMLILKYSREARRFNSEITASFNEHLNGVEVNKSLVQEERVSEEFVGLSEKMRNSSYKSAYYSAMYFPLVVFIGSLGAAFIVYYGGLMALEIPPAITVGTLAAFFGYATFIFEPVMDISRFYSQAQNSLSAGERIFSLFDTQLAIYDIKGSDDFEKINGDIDFEHVFFSYEEGKPVLQDFNLKINAGQSVALVGETGSGKSTIINLMCRFYEPTKGKIKIDGFDLKSKTLHSLRSQFGVVLQTPHLFSGTVRENILYGRENATDEEIFEVLKLAGAEEFCDKLDDETGESGDNLSMGQRQLISFARAILSDPRIFIMDEATSSVDTLTEANIQRGIANILKERTSIIIAHRLSTIKNCKRIIVIEKGKIIEDGNHYSLMKKKGYYYNLYTRQLREQREKELIGI